MKIKIIFIILIFFNVNRVISEVIKLKPTIKMSIPSSQEKIRQDYKNWQKNFLNIEILEKTELKDLPSVIMNSENRLLTVANQELYVKNLNQLDLSKDLAIYRLSAPIKDFQNKKILGYYLYFVADIKLENLNIKDNISSVKVLNSIKEVSPGDKILIKTKVNTNFILEVPKILVNGHIIGIIEGIANAYLNQTIIIDLGKNDGLQDGNILSVYSQEISPKIVKLHDQEDFGSKIKLPEEKVGSLLVYRTYNNMSLALVIEEKKPLLIHQKVTI